MRREWIEILSPQILPNCLRKSPSMRREWIEMNKTYLKCKNKRQVSLHAEGVD